MGTTTRIIPKSYESIWIGIKRAKQKKDHPSTTGNVLSESTGIRLDTMYTDFSLARKLLAQSQMESSKATSEKDDVLAMQKMLNSQYIQVFNFHIDRGIFPASFRASYKMPVNSAAVPSQVTEDLVEELANNIIEGEPLMIAAGGKAIPYPILKDISDNLTLLITKQFNQSNAMDKTDNAKLALNELSDTASTLVKKVWDEVETYYDEGTIENKRKYSREWGVTYVNVGNPVTIKGYTVVQVGTNVEPLENVNVLLVETDETTTSGNEGLFSLKTTSTGLVTLRFSLEGYIDKDLVREIENSHDIDLGNVVLQRKG